MIEQQDEQRKKEYGLLTLTMRLNESVIFGESMITVTMLKNKTLRLTFNAPKDVKINRTNRLDSKKK